MKRIIAFTSLALFSISAWAQQPKDKSVFREQKPGYFQNSILKGIEDYKEKEQPKEKPKVFKVDVSGMDVPKNAGEFSTFWKNEPISQGNTGTCWSFSTTSYFETEVYRLTKQQVKLSQIYTAYWEYVDKAKRFVDKRGNSTFDEGSEANGVTRIYREYGIVPLEDYSGRMSGQEFHDHTAMVGEMKKYLQGVKDANAWNSAEVIATIKSIMNHYIGEPPAKVKVNGKEISPQDYLKNVLKLNMDEYVDVTSIASKPFWEKVEYEVPDNWWHSSDYYNIPVEDYMTVLKKAVRDGYTMMIGGDVSEAGFDSQNNVAIVPSFDIPSAYIDDNARYFRFANGSTTDDHGMHLVGWMQKNGKDWYLVKDSGAGSRFCGKQSENFGFYFFHEDFVKLKMMTLLIHRDAMKDYMPKFKT